MDFFQTFWSPSDLPSVPLSKIPSFSFNQTLMCTMCPKSNYSTPKWWKEAVVYQVYPASFNCGKPTSKTNGWGDVDGFIDKIPYLKSLGVDIVWLSPNYTPLFVLMLCLHETQTFMSRERILPYLIAAVFLLHNCDYCDSMNTELIKYLFEMICYFSYLSLFLFGFQTIDYTSGFYLCLSVIYLLNFIRLYHGNLIVFYLLLFTVYSVHFVVE
ncbi:hypothetical protein ASPTUDRAFT_353578 [Aspergillus tubingensis CBS 134.48]|uniref:Glycosyl hydrolase family 13 catalytic domain-containing protein n=1 Tax=Aspergillus tubingensis (strain CBS 134.48) TaxID=767770 RepID=A0A1L9NI09_ASPTC|nr:hypothetical protein ASPTUDRAFT_353578 [Aspergillus tubingensis CBS 134.48]